MIRALVASKRDSYWLFIATIGLSTHEAPRVTGIDSISGIDTSKVKLFLCPHWQDNGPVEKAVRMWEAVGGDTVDLMSEYSKGIEVLRDHIPA